MLEPELSLAPRRRTIRPERSTAEAHAAVLAELLDGLRHRRADIVGSSMGGGIAPIYERPPRIPGPMLRHLARDRSRRHDAEVAMFRAWEVTGPDPALSPAALESLRTPALVLHGARVRVVDPSTARALARHLPRAHLEILDGVGHAPQLEAPRVVARRIGAFLEGVV